jgi:hypothetical protein
MYSSGIVGLQIFPSLLAPYVFINHSYNWPTPRFQDARMIKHLALQVRHCIQPAICGMCIKIFLTEKALAGVILFL